MGLIARLSGGVVSRLRSTSILTDVDQAVDELICNSLDAGATQVRVQLDEGGSSVKVEDDGHGISRHDLTLVGVRHATSKLHTLEELEAGVKTLGFRGEALSSLSDISLLEITSRVQGCPHTYRKIMKGSSTVSMGLCSQQRVRGTTVVLRDIFYNQPVRRRLFVSSPRKVLQSVKERVLRLALAHPYVSFTVTDSLRLEEVMHIRRQASLYGTLQEIFGCDFCNGLQEVDFAKGPLRLSGFLSNTVTHSSKAVQYLYINHRFVHKTPIHKVLNAWGRRNEAYSHGAEARRKKDVNLSTGRQLYPAFVLNLSCHVSNYDITFEASKTYVEFKDWIPVLSFLEDVLLATWGSNVVVKKQGYDTAAKSTGKRKSWCSDDLLNNSPLDKRIKGDQAQNSNCVSLQADSANVSELRSRSLHIAESLEACVFQCPDDQHISSDLQTFSPGSGPLLERTLFNEEANWLTPSMKLPSSMGKYLDPVALTSPRWHSADVLCLSSPDLQALPRPSSPALSDESWGYGQEHVEHLDVQELSPTQSPSMEYGDVHPGRLCFLPERSGFLCRLHSLPSSGSETWESLPAVKDKLHSVMNSCRDHDWILPAATSSDKLSQSPRAWDEPICAKSPLYPEILSLREVTEDPCLDVGEAHFRLNLPRWPGRHTKCASAVDSPRPMGTSDQEHHWVQTAPELLHPSGVGLPDCSSLQIADTGKDEVAGVEEIMNVVKLQGSVEGVQPCDQANQAWTACPESFPHDHLLLSKWHTSNERDVAHFSGPSQNGVASMYKVWLNPCMRANGNDVLDMSAGILGSSTNSLLPDVVAKESLQHARVLQQVDTKFIAVVAGNVLLLVDQHAADERVRLEELRAHVLAADKKQSSMRLDIIHDLALGLSQQQTLDTYQQQVEEWGWHVQAVPKVKGLSKLRGQDGGACDFQLSAVPRILGVSLTAADLEEYLEQLATTNGVSLPPPAVVRLLNFKSCRGAIMFGDSLLPAECQQLVNHLKRTSLCFQCAHGRPTMVPLVNLLALRQLYRHQVESNELGAITTSSELETGPFSVHSDGAGVWHGLVDRPLSLLRSRRRLHQYTDSQ